MKKWQKSLHAPGVAILLNSCRFGILGQSIYIVWYDMDCIFHKLLSALHGIVVYYNLKAEHTFVSATEWEARELICFCVIFVQMSKKRILYGYSLDRPLWGSLHDCFLRCVCISEITKILQNHASYGFTPSLLSFLSFAMKKKRKKMYCFISF